MIFTPKNIVLSEGKYKISKNVKALSHKSLTDKVFAEFWQGFI